jgi:hypothetical protein
MLVVYIALVFRLFLDTSCHLIGLTWLEISVGGKILALVVNAYVGKTSHAWHNLYCAAR